MSRTNQLFVNIIYPLNKTKKDRIIIPVTNYLNKHAPIKIPVGRKLFVERKYSENYI